MKWMGKRKKKKQIVIRNNINPVTESFKESLYES